MIEPDRFGPDLVADIRSTRTPPGAVTIWRLGQAGFVCAFAAGPRVVVDPYLSNHCEAVLGAPQDHRRLTRAPLDGSELAFADVIVCTHDHLDHLDVPTLRSAARLRPRPAVVAPTACAPVLEDLGWPRRDLWLTEDGTRHEIAGLEVTAFAVPHDDYDRHANGSHPYQGFTLRTADSPTVAHVGDARADDRVRDALERLRADLGLLPINGRDRERAALGFAGNMSADEAVALARAAGLQAVVPMHYDMFEQNVDDGALGRFTEQATRAGLPHRVLSVGQRWTFTAD